MPCYWKQDRQGNRWTYCGEEFQFNDGGPRENKMEYCCYCGGTLEELPYIDLLKPEEEIEKHDHNTDLHCPECGAVSCGMECEHDLERAGRDGGKHIGDALEELAAGAKRIRDRNSRDFLSGKG